MKKICLAIPLLILLFVNETLGVAHARKLEACKNFTTAEQYKKDQLTTFGLHIIEVDRKQLIEEISPDFQNDADLQVGDQIIHINGHAVRPSLVSVFCSGHVSALVMVKRDDRFFEVVLTLKNAAILEKYSVDFKATNPFKWNRGLDGRRTKSVIDSPTLAAFFDGDFSKFDDAERVLLIVFINAAVSQIGPGNFPYEQVTDGLKAIYGDVAASCFPYGYTKIKYETYVTKRDSYGNTISHYKSRFSGGPILFDPVFSDEMYAKWKEGLGWGAYNEIKALIHAHGYGCDSIEYRMLYNRMFQLRNFR